MLSTLRSRLEIKSNRDWGLAKKSLLIEQFVTAIYWMNANDSEEKKENFSLRKKNNEHITNENEQVDSLQSESKQYGGIHLYWHSCCCCRCCGIKSNYERQFQKEIFLHLYFTTNNNFYNFIRSFVKFVFSVAVQCTVSSSSSMLPSFCPFFVSCYKKHGAKTKSHRKLHAKSASSRSNSTAHLQTLHYYAVKSIEFSNIRWWLILQLSRDGFLVLFFLKTYIDIIKRTNTVLYVDSYIFAVCCGCLIVGAVHLPFFIDFSVFPLTLSVALCFPWICNILKPEVGRTPSTYFAGRLAAFFRSKSLRHDLHYSPMCAQANTITIDNVFSIARFIRTHEKRRRA